MYLEAKKGYAPGHPYSRLREALSAITCEFLLCMYTFEFSTCWQHSSNETLLSSKHESQLK